VQRLRWMVAMAIIMLTSRTTQDVLHPMQWRNDGSEGTWRELLALVGVFAFPAMFTALVAHSVPFRLQLLLGPLTVIQHVAFGLPHQLRALDALGLRRLTPRVCTTLYALLDPTALGYGPGSAPAHCAAPGFFLVYTYVILAGVLPSHLYYWTEYRQKLAFLRSWRAAAAPGEVRGRWEGWDQANDVDLSLMTALVQFWAACAVCWALVACAYHLLPLAPAAA
jgi:hypothetical protein